MSCVIVFMLYGKMAIFARREAFAPHDKQILKNNVMGILSKLFRKKDNAEQKTGGIEDFMSLLRVYFQAAIAADLGITNLAMLPDLRIFKRTLHVATVNNKLGIGEKSKCKKMLKEIYNIDDNFFKEIDQSLKKNCRKVTDVQTYMYQFNGFSQDLMMLIGNLMKFKLRIPSIFKKSIYLMTEKTVTAIFEKNNFKDAATIKTVVAVREYSKRLGFSRKWITDFVYHVVMLAKKEPKHKDEDNDKNTNKD